MITYGFYDSINHDRRYNSIQFGSIFDGIIRDGIFMSIGDAFRVTPSDEMSVLVAPGRAWFNHTWTLNDAPLPLSIPKSEVLLDRIDAIVLDINSDNSVRANDILVIKGSPSQSPQRPTLINNDSRHQYPLAYISVRAGVTWIRAADITNMIGTSSTPYVTGILETVNIDALLDKWEDQWDEWFNNETSKDAEEWDSWFNNETSKDEKEWDDWYNQFKSIMEEWKTNEQNEFIEWFETLEYILNGDVGAKLTIDVLKLREEVDSLNKFKEDLLYHNAIYNKVQDSSSENILDDSGKQIDAQIIFEIKKNEK